MMEVSKDQDEISDEVLENYLIAAPMKNDLGEQNSFINVVIHLLHYIPEISKYIIETDISEEEQYNMLIEIQRLLDKYDKLTSILYCPKISKNLRSLSILQLRRELEYLFTKEKLFKVQTTGDSIDAYFFLLNGIHSYCNNNSNLKAIDDNDCNSSECVVHSNLMINLVEQLECPKCLKKSDLQKFPNNTFHYELKTDYIIKKTDRMHYLNNFKGKLFQFSKEVVGETEEECPQYACRDSHCIMKRNVILVSSNKYTCFSLSWFDSNPKLTDICKVYFSIPDIFSNEEIFSIYDAAYKKEYELYGIICYSNAHYICFFISQLKSEVEKYWILHNDMEIIKFPVWRDVITYCIMNRYHPIMLYYREAPDKPDLSMRSILLDEDYYQMLNHSLKIDLENAITYSNETNAKNKVRPSKNLTKSQDENLLKALNNMKMESMAKKKKRISKDFRDQQDDESVNQTEGTKKYSSRGETEETMNIPSQAAIDDSKQEKYQQIDAQALQSEAFRYNPYQREGDWFCKTENCGNLNSKNTFQCLYCKAINMNKFQAMEKEKENRVKPRNELLYTYNNNTSMIQQQCNNLRVHNNNTNTYQDAVAMSKLCINCNSPFKRKCNTCLPMTQSFQTLEDSNKILSDISKNNSKHIPIPRNDFVTISKTENSGGWVCFHCSSYNIMGFDFCKDCKQNKPAVS